jgi:hypothetical protein
MGLRPSHPGPNIKRGPVWSPSGVPRLSADPLGSFAPRPSDVGKPELAVDHSIRGTFRVAVFDALVVVASEWETLSSDQT